MKINNILIENFRAIKKVELKNLGSMVVISGSNGCGKTQIYHAIRLLKSSYGGYQVNEVQQWWGEFQINLNEIDKRIFTIFRDKSQPLHIKIDFEITESERAFLIKNAEKKVTSQIWNQVVPGLNSSIFTAQAYAQAQRTHRGKVKALIQKEMKTINNAFSDLIHTGELFIAPDLETESSQSIVLEHLFSTFNLRELGIIDYHSAQRTYNREKLGGINLNIEQSQERNKQSSLYNSANKYSNIKSELASNYVRDLISAEAGGEGNSTTSLVETLQDLFNTFFPGKSFPGPVPGNDGTLDFPVIFTDGAEHDIDELSSGEKEVLFGYLRLTNNDIKNSVILLDEPELHLNPALIIGLPQFYYKYIGVERSNQLWLMTHSDALLREAVGLPNYSVYHMKPSMSVSENVNQMVEIDAGDSLEMAVVDLIGDLATYKPGSKVIIFEGEGESKFDVDMTSRLFSEELSNVNLISAGSKKRVKQLHSLLEETKESGVLKSDFYSIVDKDSSESLSSSHSYSWDRYHIENYLLESKFIFEVLEELNETSVITSAGEVHDKLKECAKSTLDKLVRHELESKANRMLSNSIKTNTDRSKTDIANVLYQAIKDSQDRINEVVENQISLESLQNAEAECRSKLEQDLTTGDWILTFKGRDILRAFVNQHVSLVNYEALRNLIIARMTSSEFKPAGMQNVISKILNDNED